MTSIHSDPRPAIPSQQAYVIEIGETQAGLVNRRADERYFTFIAASAAFHALEGHRFATPGAAELAVRQLAGAAPQDDASNAARRRSTRDAALQQPGIDHWSSHTLF